MSWRVCCFGHVMFKRREIFLLDRGGGGFGSCLFGYVLHIIVGTFYHWIKYRVMYVCEGNIHMHFLFP
jgi:hypothetical protein